MTILGAILAGGEARRFGSDKALAELGGTPLIAHVAAALAPHVDALVVCGRVLDGFDSLPDPPGPRLGPLGGLAAALHHARAHGFDRVLSAPCDTPRLPAELLAALTLLPCAVIADLPVLGIWPTALADGLDRFLADDARRSMRGWAAQAGATRIEWPQPIANVNAPADLRAIDLG